MGIKGLIIFLLILMLPTEAFAGLFSKDQLISKKPEGKQEVEKTNEILILDTIAKLIIKRKKEAQKLIMDGKELIKKGEKRKDKGLITKGQIKKEIGEKQLLILKEQADSKKKQDESDEW